MGKLLGTGWGNSSVLNDAEAELTLSTVSDSNWHGKSQGWHTLRWIWGVEDITTHKKVELPAGPGLQQRFSRYSKNVLEFPKSFCAALVRGSLLSPNKQDLAGIRHHTSE